MGPTRVTYKIGKSEQVSHGGMQMCLNPMTSVVDGKGRMRQMDDVFCSDSSVFATSGGCNPANTIMAVALRTARGLTGRRPMSPAPSAYPAFG